MYERAKGVLPRAIDEVGYNYAQARNKGIYLEHLEVKRNLEVISDMLKNDLNKLRNGDPQGVHEDLNDCEKTYCSAARTDFQRRKKHLKRSAVILISFMIVSYHQSGCRRYRKAVWKSL